MEFKCVCGTVGSVKEIKQQQGMLLPKTFRCLNCNVKALVIAGGDIELGNGGCITYASYDSKTEDETLISKLDFINLSDFMKESAFVYISSLGMIKDEFRLELINEYGITDFGD